MNSSHFRPGLTIAIPTYNRPEELTRTLEVIIPQVIAREDVFLNIYDNCGEKALPAFQDPRLVNHPRVNLVRNRHNVGIGNITKCFYHCETQWLWVLADDDLPQDDAVETIFSKVDPDLAYISFRIPTAKILTGLSQDLRGKGLADFFKQFNSRYLEMMCLSSSVYNLQQVWEFFAVAYQHMTSAAPHTLMAMLAIEKGADWLCSPACIADYKYPDEAEHWNRVIVFMGLPSIIPAFKLASSRNLLREAISKSWGQKPKKFLAQMERHYGKENTDKAKTFAAFRAFYSPKLKEHPLKYFKWLLLQWQLNLGLK